MSLSLKESSTLTWERNRRKKQRNYKIQGSVSDYYLPLKHMESNEEPGAEGGAQGKQTPLGASEPSDQVNLLERLQRDADILKMLPPRDPYPPLHTTHL